MSDTPYYDPLFRNSTWADFEATHVKRGADIEAMQQAFDIIGARLNARGEHYAELWYWWDKLDEELLRQRNIYRRETEALEARNS